METNELSEAELSRAKEFLVQQPAEGRRRKPVGPIRLSEEDLPIQRASESSSPTGRATLFTTEDDTENDDEQPQQHHFVRAPSKSMLRGPGLPPLPSQSSPAPFRPRA